MPDHSRGAQRASSRKIRSLLIAVFAALIVATGATAIGPGGPGSDPQGRHRRRSRRLQPPRHYKDSARKLADQARSYGAAVKEIYSPYATWSRVRDASVRAPTC